MYLDNTGRKINTLHLLLGFLVRNRENDIRPILNYLATSRETLLILLEGSQHEWVTLFNSVLPCAITPQLLNRLLYRFRDRVKSQLVSQSTLKKQGRVS